MTLYPFRFEAMAATNEFQVHASTPEGARFAAALAIEEVRRIEAKYSRYRPESVLSRINAAAGSDPVPIDPETAQLLAYADSCYRMSDGLFDATSGILRRAWDFKKPRVPTERELAPLRTRIGWPRVELTATTVRLPDAGMELDFGGFGKEYAVDRAVAVLLEQGVSAAMVNLAGDLAITGPQPGGAPWRVGVQHPRRAGTVVATVEVASGALATSGDYERYVEVDGVRHCHVLDPRSGQSARGFQSVTAIAPACLVAGTATTIAMLKGAQNGLEWLGSLGLAHLCVLEDGTIVDRTGGRPGGAC